MLMENLDNYLEARRATGFKLIRAEKNLRNFVSFACERGDQHVLAQTAIKWASQADSQIHRGRRLKDVILFARFIRAEDDRHEIPPRDVFACRIDRRTPYIFSKEEIHALIEHAQRLKPHDSLRPHTYSTLFALLATTGLRVSEALNLRVGDFTRDGLLIRETKFRKSRLLPLHETTVEALKGYIDRRRALAGIDDHLFLSLWRRKLAYSTVTPVFRKIRRAAGIPESPGMRNPRIHDLRHTFAVRALENCPSGRDKITGHMMALSTYLGHTHINCTYWYLEHTPQLMKDIADACEAFRKECQT